MNQQWRQASVPKPSQRTQAKPAYPNQAKITRQKRQHSKMDAKQKKKDKERNARGWAYEQFSATVYNVHGNIATVNKVYNEKKCEKEKLYESKNIYEYQEKKKNWIKLGKVWS